MTSATVALGASALAAGWIWRRNRIQEWETLSCEDCDEGGFVTLEDGARMHYTVQGTVGDDVILIHGLMSTTNEWVKNVGALAASHRVWAVDLIGFGYSSRVTEPTYSLRYLAHSINEFMESQGIERAHIVGHSLGGAIALQFAHDYPTRVNRLVLLAPAAYIFSWLKPVRYAARVPFLPRRVGAWLLTNPHVHRVAYRNALGDPRRMDSQMLDARIRATRVKGTLDALLAMCSSREACELPEGLPELHAPALVIWGDRDNALPTSHGYRLVRDLPNAKLVILEGAGHLPNSEFPDRINRLMLDFFRG